MPKDYNLDTGVEESFTFILLKNKYSFRYPNTEELQDWANLDKDNDTKLIDFLNKYITPLEGAQPFEESYKKMLSPHLIAFKDMLYEALGLKAMK